MVFCLGDDHRKARGLAATPGPQMEGSVVEGFGLRGNAPISPGSVPPHALPELGPEARHPRFVIPSPRDGKDTAPPGPRAAIPRQNMARDPVRRPSVRIAQRRHGLPDATLPRLLGPLDPLPLGER